MELQIKLENPFCRIYLSMDKYGLNKRYDFGAKYFRKELGKADFLIILVMVNTCCLIPNNSK